MKKRPLATVCIVVIVIQIVFVTTGMWEDFHIPATLHKILKKEGKLSLSLSGQVYRKDTRQKDQILYLRNTEISVLNQKYENIKCIVYDTKCQKVKLGNTIRVIGELQVFDMPRNPGNFDQRFYYAKQGIFYKVFAKELEVLGKKEWKLQEGIQKFRRRWHTMLLRALGEKKGGMLSAMMTGEKEYLDRESRELYQINGIGHILAISGLHLSFIGLAFYQGLRKTGMSYFSAGLLGGSFLLVYAVMTGLSVSTQRAMVMLLLRIGADLCGRVYDIVTALCFSAAVIVVQSPLFVFDAGFLLSFGAIIGITWLLPIWKEIWFLGNNEFGGVKRTVVDSVNASIAIQIFLFPITSYFFFEIPLYAVVLNVIVIPLLSVILGAGMVGSMIYYIIPWGGEKLLQIGRILLGLYDVLCEWTIKLPFSRIVVGKPKWQQVVLCYCLMVFFFTWMGKQIRKEEKIFSKWRRSGAVFLIGTILSVSIPWKGIGSEVQITMLDVGQGDGLYLRGPEGNHYFIDGGSSDVKEIGRYRIEPFLKSQGVGCLDYVFISHGDADHMNGIQEMLKRQKLGIRIRNLVLPVQEVWDETLYELAKTAQKEGIRVLVMGEGDELEEKGFSMVCLHPQKNQVLEAGNGASMVLQVKYGEFEMLFTGDVEGEGEEMLMEQQKLSQIDVLKVAHHGSEHSTTEELIRKLRPQYALISAGRKNSYGHPHMETIERLKKYGVQLYSTLESGAITVTTDGREMWIEEYIE